MKQHPNMKIKERFHCELPKNFYSHIQSSPGHLPPRQKEKRRMPMLFTRGRTEGIRYCQRCFITDLSQISGPSKSHQSYVSFPIPSRSLGDEVEVIRDDQSHHPGVTS
jgi:hypothetical protein